MKKLFIKTLSQSALIALFLFHLPALASDLTPELRTVSSDTQLKPHVGLSAGFGDPEGDINPGGNYALEVGYQPIIPLSIALELAVSHYPIEGPEKLNRTSAIIKTAYNFGGQIPVIRYGYVGLGVGPMWEDRAVQNEMALAIMPQLGFDYPIEGLADQPLSLGLNVSQLFSSSDTPDTFAMAGVIKYWY